MSRAFPAARRRSRAAGPSPPGAGAPSIATVPFPNWTAVLRFLPCLRAVLVAGACVAAACGRPDARAAGRPSGPAAVLGVDDFGDTVRAAPPPARIVSLNPTTTELLFALGAGGRLVGRTHWDVYPDAARAVADLGDGLRPNVEAVLAARPALVILYASADNRAAAAAFRRAGVPVVALKIDRVAQFAAASRLLGRVVGDSAAGAVTADTVLATIARVRAATAGRPRVRALWPLFDDPLYVIGGGSYLSELMDAAGADNVFGDLPQPSPQVAREEALRRNADVVFSSPAGARRMAREAGWASLAAVRTGRVYAVDSSLVLRPGVRLGEAAVMLAERLGAAAGPVR